MKQLLLILSLITITLSQEFSELSGHVKSDFRYFPTNGFYSGQENNYLSFAVEPKFYMEWADATQTLNVTVFYRYDSIDDNRTHFDLREAYWQYIADTWEISIGLKKVFWGVIETNHLVDIINQTDFVESFDGEQKLGQPMVHFSYPTDFSGTFDIFLLPYFRERQFPGKEGRLRTGTLIDSDEATYESSAKEKHIDASIRWSHTIDMLDFGIAHFYGTSREPSNFIFNNGKLNPYYAIINQTSLDAQLTTDNMLYKLEYIRNESEQRTYSAFSGGLEYTFGNISNTGLDIGVLAEYHFDDRHKALASSFDNDLFIGSRIALNDEQSTELLLGSSVDLENGSNLFSIEGSRRFGDSWKVNLEVRIFSNIEKTDFLYTLHKDSFTQLTIAKYF